MAIEANVGIIEARLLDFATAAATVGKVYRAFQDVRAADAAVGRTMSGSDKLLYLNAANSADTALDNARAAYETARDAPTEIEP